MTVLVSLSDHWAGMSADETSTAKGNEDGNYLMLLREFSAASQCTDLQIRAIEAVTSFVTSFQSSSSYGASQPRGRW